MFLVGVIVFGVVIDMGQREILKFLKKNRWSSIQDISRELNLQRSSVNNSVRGMIKMPDAFGIEFKIGRRRKVMIRKR